MLLAKIPCHAKNCKSVLINSIDALCMCIVGGSGKPIVIVL